MDFWLKVVETIITALLMLYIHLLKEADYWKSWIDEKPDYDYLLSFTYNKRDYGYCACTPDMPDYREDKHCCGQTCDTVFCKFSLQKILYVNEGCWNGDEYDYWKFEDEFYLKDEELAAKKEEEDRDVEIRELKKRIEEDSKRLKELEGEM